MADWGPLMMNDIDDLLDNAFNDYNRGDYVAAEQKARDALILSPTHGDCFYLLGLIAHKKGIFTQAHDLLNLAIKAYPEQNNYRLALAQVYQQHGDYEDALKLYEAFDDDPRVQIQLGWIALNQGKKEKAKNIFKKLLMGEYAAQACRGLAFCYQNQNRLQYLKKAFQMDATADLVEDIVEYHLLQHQPGKVKKYMDLIQNNLLKSKCYIALKKYVLAKEILSSYVLKNPYDTEGFVLLAVCLENLKEYSEAEKFYNQVLALDKDNFAAHQGMARLMMRQEKLSVALDHYQILCRMNPEDKETLLAMALIQEGLGENTEALGLYFRLLTLKCHGLSSKIKNCIQKIAVKDKPLAKKFAQGWLRSFPKSKIAKNLVKTLGVVLLVVFWMTPLKADYFSDDENWNLAWKNKMAEFGLPESQYELAQMFEMGKGVPQNVAQAIRYYQLSAAQDYLPAMLRLGDLLNQEGAFQDSEKSLQWYTYAAQKGEVQAQLYLADFYQNVQPDKVLAKYWLEKALKKLFPGATDLSQVSPDYKKLMESQ